MSELKEFEAKIEEAKTKEEQHKATRMELEKLKNDLGGRKENIIRVEKDTILKFIPSDRLARQVAASVANDALEILGEVGRMSGRYWEHFENVLTPKVLYSINFCLDSYGYEKDYSEEARVEVMDLDKGSQEAIEAMGAKVEKLKAELKAMEAECYRALSEASASKRDLHALRLELASMQEENDSLKATVQKLRDELRDATHNNEEEGKSYLNRLIRRL